jgi:GTP-binding protein Era
MGERLNTSAVDATGGVDVVCLVLDATGAVGRGDRFVADRLPRDAIVVVNKVDKVGKGKLLERLSEAATLDFDAYFPVSATTGEGIEALVEELVRRLPEGPRYYPAGTVSDMPEAVWVAELVREQLFHVMREELPHSITTRVTEWEWPRIRCEILVERESQKGMVIGRRGGILKDVGTAVREQLPPGAYIELAVRVDRDWQRKF